MARNGRAVRGASDHDGWARASQAGGAATARHARKFHRRKIVGVAADPIGKAVDLLECGHTNWPPESRGAGEAKWTYCQNCPKRIPQIKVGAQGAQP